MASSSRQEAVRALKEMFPGLEERTIKASLLTSQGDVNSAAEWLLVEGLATSAPASSPQAPAALLSSSSSVEFPRLPPSSPAPSSSHRGVAPSEPSAANLSVEPTSSTEEEIYSSPSLSPSSQPVDHPPLPSFLLHQQESEPSQFIFSPTPGTSPPLSSASADRAGGLAVSPARPVGPLSLYPNHLMDSVPLLNPTSDPSSFVPSVEEFGETEEGIAVKEGNHETAEDDAAAFALADSQDGASGMSSKATQEPVGILAGQGEEPAEVEEGEEAAASAAPASVPAVDASSEAVPAPASLGLAPPPLQTRVLSRAKDASTPSSSIPTSGGLSGTSPAPPIPAPEVTVVVISDSESDCDGEEESECESLEESESADEDVDDESEDEEEDRESEESEEESEEGSEDGSEEESEVMTEDEEEVGEAESEDGSEDEGADVAGVEGEGEDVEGDAEQGEAGAEDVVVGREGEEDAPEEVQGADEFESVEGEGDEGEGMEGEGMEGEAVGGEGVVVESESVDAEGVEAKDVEAEGVVVTRESMEGEKAEGAGDEEEAEDGLEVVEAEEASAEEGAGSARDQGESESLSWSVGSFSVLGSHLDFPSFNAGFDSVLGRSSSLRDDLREGIESVTALQVRLKEAPVEAERAEANLQMARAAAEEQQNSMAWRLQHAREALDSRASEIAGERSTLHFEARLLLNRARELTKGREDVKEQLAELKAVLSGRVGEVEARIEGVAREMQALLEAQRQRRSAEQEEMDALAARKQSLDEEEADCTQLKEFLMDRSQALDTIESGLLQCAEKIQALHHTILGGPVAPAPAPEGTVNEAQGQGAPLASAGAPKALGGSGVFVGGDGAGSMMSFASASQHSEHSQAGLGGDVSASASASASGTAGGGPAAYQRAASQRGAMREALGPLMSSSEGSSASGASSSACSSSASPSLYASAEAFAADPRSAAVHTLSLMEREQLVAAIRQPSLLHTFGAPASAVGVPARVGAPEEAPIVRVFEGEGQVEGPPSVSSVQNDAAGRGAAAGDAHAGSESPERDGDWDLVSHPEDEE